ncbi:hypothetical protein HDV00_003865 [Rhizophlyctis rosea]|nr:hypothetical protein HDV00_003865 [Rhizophlyctis rosea]
MVFAGNEDHSLEKTMFQLKNKILSYFSRSLGQLFKVQLKRNRSSQQSAEATSNANTKHGREAQTPQPSASVEGATSSPRKRRRIASETPDVESSIEEVRKRLHKLTSPDIRLSAEVIDEEEVTMTVAARPRSRTLSLSSIISDSPGPIVSTTTHRVRRTVVIDEEEEKDHGREDLGVVVERDEEGRRVEDSQAEELEGPARGESPDVMEMYVDLRESSKEEEGGEIEEEKEEVPLQRKGREVHTTTSLGEVEFYGEGRSLGIVGMGTGSLLDESEEYAFDPREDHLLGALRLEG